MWRWKMHGCALKTSDSSMPAIAEAHEFAIYNRAALEAGEWAACYHCREVFSPSEIGDFTDEGQTAMCPYCGVDAVLPESAGYPFLPEVLKALREHWFGPAEDESCPLD